eukprot:TRINITY_DN1085_c0_g1_i3.p1 TRINITY_DN1085_c0_g1~~TRINITY_DN1085_c0_g1_i3.p1  ORF type:complete len:1132 (+),score=201.31 TRINITY_DN1085_c0_g1_i3:92-3487(+)
MMRSANVACLRLFLGVLLPLAAFAAADVSSAYCFDSAQDETAAASRVLLQSQRKVRLQVAATVGAKANETAKKQVSNATKKVEVLGPNTASMYQHLLPTIDGVDVPVIMNLEAVLFLMTALAALAVHFWCQYRSRSHQDQASAPKENTDALLNKPNTAGSNSKFPSNEECLGRPPATRSKECLPELFFKNASLYEKKTALIALNCGQRSEVSYGKFAEMTTKVAKQLLTMKVKQGDRVLILLHRGVHQMVAIYACMAVGAVWVPVDPDVPDSWLEYVLDDSGAVLILEEEGASNSKRTTVQVLKAPEDGSLFKEAEGKVVDQSTKSLPSPQNKDPVVVFYTSGSTGKPKGVLHNFEQLQNAAYGIAEDAHVTKDSIALLRSPAVWSTFEWEAFPAIMVGATLVLAEPQGHKDPLYLARVMEEESVNMMAITPKSLDLVLDAVEQQGYKLPHLKDLASTGEQLPSSLAKRFLAMLSHVNLHNGYNPTESAACTWYTMPEGGLDLKTYPTNVPAGVPQPGVSVYIMDADDTSTLKQLPEGEEGEILLGGLLSEGYWCRPELTKEKFVVSESFGRLYRTGDKGKWENGMLITMGRIDRQVKVRGIRVEPEEVEAIMSGVWSELRTKDTATGSAGVACVATLGNAPELVAFVAPKASQEELVVLEKAVRTQLPAYYCPSSFRSLDRLPALPNGKVDLKALSRKATEEKDDTVTGTDSLGTAKVMLKQAFLEQEVIFHCYTLWCLGTMVTHFGVCGMSALKGCVTMPAGTPPWIAAIARSLAGDQTLFGFAVLFAYQDSRDTATSDPEQRPRIKWVQKDALLLWSAMVLGPLFALINNFRELGGVKAGQGFSSISDFYAPAETSLRWFLFTIIFGRIYIWLFQKLEDSSGGRYRVPAWLQILGCFVWAGLGKTLHGEINICRYQSVPEGLKIIVANFLAAENNVPNHCPLTLWSSHVYFLAAYVIAFHYSLQIVAFSRKVVKDFTDPAWGVIALGIYWMIAVFVGLRSPQLFDQASWAESDRYGGIVYVPFLWAAYIAMIGLYVFAASWFPFSAKHLGAAMLGSYLSHIWLTGVYPGMARTLGGGETLSPPAILMMIIGFPLLWMATLGPVAQYLLLFPMRQFFKTQFAQSMAAKF